MNNHDFLTTVQNVYEGYGEGGLNAVGSSVGPGLMARLLKLEEKYQLSPKCKNHLMCFDFVVLCLMNDRSFSNWNIGNISQLYMSAEVEHVEKLGGAWYKDIDTKVYTALSVFGQSKGNVTKLDLNSSLTPGQLIFFYQNGNTIFNDLPAHVGICWTNTTILNINWNPNKPIEETGFKEIAREYGGDIIVIDPPQTCCLSVTPFK